MQVRVLRRLAKEPRSLSQLGADLMLAPPFVTLSSTVSLSAY
jgi:hypothetical protein